MTVLEGNKRHRLEHWHRLRLAKEDYYGIYDRLTETTPEFYQHLKKQYGIKLDFDNSGNITDTYQIIDEKKYMLFILKYPK
jgi:hypothetical protein